MHCVIVCNEGYVMQVDSGECPLFTSDIKKARIFRYDEDNPFEVRRAIDNLVDGGDRRECFEVQKVLVTLAR